jgi:hypothetical protein
VETEVGDGQQDDSNEVNNMRQSGMTIVFVLVCAIMLVGAYGLGICIREYRFHRAGVGPQAAAVQKPTAESAVQSATGRSAPALAPAAGAPEGVAPPGGRPGFGGDRMAAMRDRFANMSDEERQQAMSQMRDRSGGRRRQGMPQLSEEDREKMRAEMEDLRARWESMSDEERQEAQAQMREKYGFAPRGFGGNRGFGGADSSRRSGGEPNSGQQ